MDMPDIRVATIDNLKDIQLMNKKLFDEEYAKYDKTINCDWPLSKEGEDFYKERIVGSKGCAFLLFDNKELIGYLVGSLSDDEFYRNINNFAELDDMYILEEYRSKKYGSYLYAEFIKWCKAKNVKRLKVLVTAKNKQAIQYYQKKGFNDYNVTLEMN